MAETNLAGKPRFIVYLVLVVAAGIPLAGYLWETVSQLLSGQVDGRRLLISTPLLVTFLALLIAGGRLFSRAAMPSRPAAADDDPDVSGTLFLTALILMFIFGVWVVMYLFLLNR